MDLQHRMSGTLEEEVDELHTTLTSPEICQDGANSKQRSQETMTDHRVDSHIALRWTWSNSIRHLTIYLFIYSIKHIYTG